MTQLREEGWIHHLAFHSVASFLTRGQLWISWEEGMKVNILYCSNNLTFQNLSVISDAHVLVIAGDLLLFQSRARTDKQTNLQ